MSFSRQHVRDTVNCWPGWHLLAPLSVSALNVSAHTELACYATLQSAGVDVLEVTAPDKMERRRRGKSDTIDAESAAHAAFSRIRTVTPKTRGGMIEALRVLKVCRKTAVAARHTALKMIQMNIVSAPDELRDQIRSLTRMQLIRTLTSRRPDVTAYRNVQDAYRIALKSLARRYLELHDEIRYVSVNRR